MADMIMETTHPTTSPALDEGESSADDDPGPSRADVLVEHEGWRELAGAENTVHRAVIAAAVFEPRLAQASITVALTSDAALRALNSRFRGQDKPTNVLTFPAKPDPGLPAGTPSGDIAIAYETVVAEAGTEGKSARDHLSHLTVHGLLHLAGYDHEHDREAERMEGLERRILASLGIADPYSADTEDGHSPIAAGSANG